MKKIKENAVKKAIETIEPAAGTKERMLANIQRKAALRNTPEAKRTQPKAPWLISAKKWALPVAACLVIAVFGATVIPRLVSFHGQSHIVSPTETGNPFVEVSGAEEFERQLGFSIDAPESAEDTIYHIIDGRIADVDFATGAHRYNLRASRDSGDFSGLFAEETRTEPIHSEKNALLTVLQSDGEQYIKIVWSDKDVNYILSNTDGASENDMKKLFELLV